LPRRRRRRSGQDDAGLGRAGDEVELDASRGGPGVLPLAGYDARIHHVQADVGHASIATTQHYDRARRSRTSTAADLVADALGDPAAGTAG